nr:hypothetical protein [Xylella fastidiosa]
MITPPQGLLQPCEEPPLPRVETVRDVLNQTLGWRLAYEHCAAQVRCVAAWVQAASVGQPWSPQGWGKRANEAGVSSIFFAPYI